MAVIQVTAFSGAIPIRDPRLLPDEAAVQAVNARTDGGALKAIAEPALIKAVTAGTKKVYKLPYSSAPGNAPIDPRIMAGAVWLEYTDKHTDVFPGPTVNDSYKRFYWCSPSTGFRYATLADLLAGSTGGKPVGIEVPPTPLFVAPAGGSPDAPTVTRAYIQTFVSIYGEEGQAGPPTEASGKSDANWVVSSIDQPVNAPGTTQIDRIRIYRTITSAAGVTTYYRVTTVPVGTTVFNDDLTDAVVSANTQVESLLWAPPPANLQGIVAMPNGIFVGWVDKTLYFSENFRPHAWPAEYALAVPFPIVGLGVFGNTCVVCTEGNPATVTGLKPSIMALSQGRVSMPCLSRSGIVSTLDGVYYGAEDGLVFVTAGGSGNVTQQIIPRDKWISEFNAMDHMAFYSRGIYNALYSDTGIMLPTGVQPSSQGGVVEVDLFSNVVNASTDDWSGKGWVLDGTNLYEWEPVEGDPTLTSWLSKEFAMPRMSNMAVYQIFYDENDPLTDGVRFRLWADGRLVYDADVVVSGKEHRLPSGYKAHVWQFEVFSRVRIHTVNIANSSKELRGV